MSNSIDPPADVTLITLVSFMWGPDNYWGSTRNTYAYYCTDSQPMVLSGATFLSEPDIEVTMNRQQGGSQDIPVDVLMRVVPPLDAMTGNAAHAPVRCRIEEINPDDPPSRRIVWGGMIRTADVNPDGKSGLIKFQVSGWKFPLEA